jgi:hypothetical protein
MNGEVATSTTTARPDLSDVVFDLGLSEQTPWAVLLFKFSDDLAEHRPRALYERLFTAAGTGTMNLVDYFSEMSHGRVDLSGSKVFGWFVLPIKRSDYEVPTIKPGKLGRGELVSLCLKTVADAGVDISGFPKRVISLNAIETELFGYFGTAVCDSTSLRPSLVGHEMGHGYGLEHSRQDGWDLDYKDFWDIMSADDTAKAPHSEYGSVGPGLNAANMRSCGWLDEGRVYTAPMASTYTRRIKLRPLHRHELDGYLAAQIGEFLVEYRPKRRWDAGFDHSSVFVHRMGGLHSFVMKGTNGFAPAYDLPAGGSFSGDPHSAVTRFTVEVEAIDDAAQVATIKIAHTTMPLAPGLLVEILAGIAPDGGGLIFWGGKIIRIPPSPPIILLVERLISLLAIGGSVGIEGSGGIAAAASDTEARRAALAGLARHVLAELAELDPPQASDEPDRRGGNDRPPEIPD